MEIIKFLKQIVSRSHKRDEGCYSFSQCGEDAIVDFVLKWTGVSDFSYLDLGANDPIKFSNTYRFYLSGKRGVLVEADPTLAAKIAKKRPKDICVAKAVTTSTEPTVDFYKMSADTLSTIESATADRYERETEHQLAQKSTVPAIHINQLLSTYFPHKAPDFVSLDVEGLDLELLKAWDFSRWRPAVLCVETLTYTQNQTAMKVQDILDLMDNLGYELYADTYINSIFVERSVWQNRR